MNKTDVTIVWNTDKYEDFGIFSGDSRTYAVPSDCIGDRMSLLSHLCREIGAEYPDLDFEAEDFDYSI